MRKSMNRKFLKQRIHRKQVFYDCGAPEYLESRVLLASSLEFDSATYVAEDGACLVCPIDYNGDGHIDLAIGNYYDHSISFKLGDGKGSFVDDMKILITDAPFSLIAADVNKDGKIDLVVSYGNSGVIRILLNDGDVASHFTYGNAYGAGSFPAAIVGDLNSDGNSDLVIVNSDDQVRILIGNGDATFTQGETYFVGSSPSFPCTGDFNKDGKVDLAIPVSPGSYVAFLMGEGDGTFQLGQSRPVSNSPHTVCSGDFNQDGIDDFAVSHFGLNQITVWTGDGKGNFSRMNVLPTEDGPRTIVSEDFNGDGVADFASVNLNGDSVSVFLMNQNGALDDLKHFPAGDGATWLCTGDFNEDGRPDLATANFQGDTMTVLLNTGLYPLNIQENLPAGTAVGTPASANQDENETYTYSIITGEDMGNDSDAFKMDGDILKTTVPLDHETQDTYALLIRFTDSHGVFFDETVNISVSDVNEAPYRLTLSSDRVAEKMPVGTSVGKVTGSDQDEDDELVYSLVPGLGSTDNALFQISGDTLKTSVVFNRSVRKIYHIRVRAADLSGLSFEKKLVIHVTPPPNGLITGNVEQVYDMNTLEPDYQYLKGQRVYADLNRNGAWDKTEPSDLTNVNGNYSLSLPAGKYIIRVAEQIGYQIIQPETNAIKVNLKSGKTKSWNDFAAAKLVVGIIYIDEKPFIIQQPYVKPSDFNDDPWDYQLQFFASMNHNSLFDIVGSAYQRKNL